MEKVVTVKNQIAKKNIVNVSKQVYLVLVTVNVKTVTTKKMICAEKELILMDIILTVDIQCTDNTLICIHLTLYAKTLAVMVSASTVDSL